uniref:Uncharacterized protein n=1 Tax=Anguilla anguilla TaxID=7936 RepID=A0A0E9VLE2_ANGAN
MIPLLGKNKLDSKYAEIWKVVGKRSEDNALQCQTIILTIY